MPWLWRGKVLAGFGLLLLLTAATVVWSVANLRRLGSASSAILRENYRSIEAMDHMRDELVRILAPGRANLYTDLPAYEETSNSVAPLDWLRRDNSFPVYISFKDVRPLLRSLRTLKDAGEIELIRKAVNASVAAHLAAMRAGGAAVAGDGRPPQGYPWWFLVWGGWGRGHPVGVGGSGGAGGPVN